MAKGSEGHKARDCAEDVGIFRRNSLARADAHSLNFPEKESRRATHPGRALGSRPECPGVRMCHYTWSPLWSVSRGRIQSGRPGLCHSYGNRVPTVPRSRSLAAVDTAAAHKAGSGYPGLGKAGSQAEELTLCRIECEPGFHLHRRQSRGTRRTTTSSPQAL